MTTWTDDELRRVGDAEELQLLSVVTALLPFIGYPRTPNAIRLIDEVVPAS